MHKFRKLLLLLLFPLTMFSCGMDKYYGYYMFQLGSDKSDHFGFHITLMDKEHSSKKGKLFTFGMKASGRFLPKNPDEDPDHPDPDPQEDLVGYLEAKFVYTLVWLLNTEDGVGGVSGYYSIGKKDIGDKGRKLDLNIVLPTELPVPIDESALKKLVIAYVDGKNVSAVLPVSLDDARYQLAWYGIFITIDTSDITDIQIGAVDLVETYLEGDDTRLPGKHGEDRLDTHPTDKERDQMNSMFGPSGEYPVTGWSEGWFKRDFHTLTVTLIKQD